ncbi:MAG: DUF938 domain-containing protein [Caulobacterales bacterium]|uniref:DUF938 domain-containing protein n=1 Tax=Glycocaulis sp. TaxID=1969725 RepID=UPI003FA14C1E
MSATPPIALEDRGQSGNRLHSPSAARNRAAIAEALSTILPAEAHVLEIASGTGEHALACITACPGISWQPSDPDPASRASADDWAGEAGGRMRLALDLDTTGEDWWRDVPDAVNAVFCANMIHIAPWEAAEGLFEGASHLLASGAMLVLYGPFLDGEATAPSNLAFDASLKARDPRWGVRTLDAVIELGTRHGFGLAERRSMPANNMILVFVRAAS